MLRVELQSRSAAKTISLHLQDTSMPGDGIVNVDAAHVLVEEGPDRIQELIDWGTQFWTARAPS
jgi:aspartate oxidase